MRSCPLCSLSCWAQDGGKIHVIASESPTSILGLSLRAHPHPPTFDVGHFLGLRHGACMSDLTTPAGILHRPVSCCWAGRAIVVRCESFVWVDYDYGCFRHRPFSIARWERAHVGEGRLRLHFVDVSATTEQGAGFCTGGSIFLSAPTAPGADERKFKDYVGGRGTWAVADLKLTRSFFF